MRPKILDPLYSSVNTISGFGPHYTALFKNFIGDRYIDLLLHLPNYSSERLNIKNIKEKYLNYTSAPFCKYVFPLQPL